ncbi:GNAT family N-acetyltransferase [Dermacoccus abyssi]|uniref:hypothetical protein n=1 Tax=Dermacoccus abyssi TaxID=322596 RepID=UPI002AD26F7C|nr:hypothetical protein [Dermacoccus abyssi]
MTIEISYATEADIDDVASLFEQYRSFYGKAPTHDARTFLEERVAGGQSLVLVARDGSASSASPRPTARSTRSASPTSGSSPTSSSTAPPAVVASAVASSTLS